MWKIQTGPSRNSPKVSDGEHALKSVEESIEDDILLVAEELPLHPNAMICRALSADFSCSFRFKQATSNNACRWHDVWPSFETGQNYIIYNCFGGRNLHTLS